MVFPGEGEEGSKHRKRRRKGERAKTDLDLANVLLGEEDLSRLRTRRRIRLPNLEVLLDVDLGVELVTGVLSSWRGKSVREFGRIGEKGRERRRTSSL